MYGGFKLYGTILRLDPTVSKVSFVRLPDEEENYKPQYDKFDFAFGLKTQLDPSIGYFTVNYINLTVTPGKEREKSKKRLKYELCGDKHFNFDKKADIKAYGIDKFYCISDNEYSL